MHNKIKKRMMVIFSIIVSLVLVKAVWVICATSGLGSFDGEKKGIIHRANYLTSKVATSPQQLLDEMPSGIGEQFQGELPSNVSEDRYLTHSYDGISHDVVMYNL